MNKKPNQTPEPTAPSGRGSSLNVSRKMKLVYVVAPVLATLAFAIHLTVSLREQDAAHRERRLHPEVEAQVRAFSGRDGRREAEADIAGGRLMLKTSGCVVDPSAIEFRAICRERFGLEEVRIAGPLVTTELMRYESAYNEAVWEYLKRRYGVEEEEIRSEAHELFWRTRKEANQPPEPTRTSAGLRIEPQGRVAHL